MRQTHGLLVAVLPLLLTACSSLSQRPLVPSAGPPPNAEQDRLRSLANSLWPVSTATYRTTRADIYLGNLDVRIDSYRRLLAGGDVQVIPRLAAALYHRYKVLGRLQDAEEALSLSETAVAGALPGIEARVLRATVLAGFHQFDDARAQVQLAQAEAAPRERAAIVNISKDIQVALGDYSALGGDFADSLSPSLDFHELAHRADLRVLQGDLAGAEFQYRAAQSIYHDVNPVPMAWLHAQMGIALLRFGRIEQAATFFRAASERLPGYALAEEHLAECEFLLGELDASRSRYLRIIEQTDNPEFMAALAEVEHARGDVPASEAWHRRAMAGYADLLSRHRDAFAWHAASYFMDRGETEQAYQLALTNHRLRGDVLSEILLAQAAAATARGSEACAARERIRRLGLNPPERQEVDALALNCPASLDAAAHPVEVSHAED